MSTAPGHSFSFRTHNDSASARKRDEATSDLTSPRPSNSIPFKLEGPKMEQADHHHGVKDPTQSRLGIAAILYGLMALLLLGIFIISSRMKLSEMQWQESSAPYAIWLPLAVRGRPSEQEFLPDAVLLGGFCSSRLKACASFAELADVQPAEHAALKALLKFYGRLYYLPLLGFVFSALTSVVVGVISRGKDPDIEDERFSNKLGRGKRITKVVFSALTTIIVNSCILVEVLIWYKAYFQSRYRNSACAKRILLNIIICFSSIGTLYLTRRRVVKGGSEEQDAATKRDHQNATSRLAQRHTGN